MPSISSAFSPATSSPHFGQFQTLTKPGTPTTFVLADDAKEPKQQLVVKVDMFLKTAEAKVGGPESPQDPFAIVGKHIQTVKGTDRLDVGGHPIPNGHAAVKYYPANKAQDFIANLESHTQQVNTSAKDKNAFIASIERMFNIIDIK